MALMYTADVKAKYAVKVSSSKCTRRLVGCDDTNDGCGHGTNGWGYPKVALTPIIVVTLMIVAVAPMVGVTPMVVMTQLLWWHQWL